MTPDSVGPLSRRLPLHRVTPAGIEATVEASEAERAALARDLGLAGIARLDGRFRLVGSRDRVAVNGRISASVEQVCVVTLEPFAVELEEDVDVTFAAPSVQRAGSDEPEVELSMELDPPDELVGDFIDLGAVAAEFLALALDPYPRKPGVSYEGRGTGDDGASPFARLAELRPGKDKS